MKMMGINLKQTHRILMIIPKIHLMAKPYLSLNSVKKY